MKNIIKFFFATLAALAFASCDELGTGNGNNGKDDGGSTELNHNIKFTLELMEVKGTSAKIKVKHDGTEKDTWYGFATTNTDIIEAVSDKYEELIAEEKISGLKKFVEYPVSVNNLEPTTEYLYIVFGITADGELYGEPAAIKFTTARGEVKMELYDAWDISYTGQKTDDKGNIYKHTVTIQSTDKTTRYIVGGSPVSAFEEQGIKEIANAELENILYYVEAGYSFDDMTIYGDFIVTLDYLFPGDWYIYALGVDTTTGTLTGQYAITEKVTIEVETATEAYSAWLGEWVCTGANGKTAKIKFNEIEGLANYYYELTGWEDLSPEDGYSILVTFVDNITMENSYWYIPSQVIGSNADGSEVCALLGLFEVPYEGKTAYAYYPEVGYEICFGAFDKNGEMTTQSGAISDGTDEYPFQIMRYLWLDSEGNANFASSYKSTTPEDCELPTFPYTFARPTAEDTDNGTGEAPASVKRLSVKDGQSFVKSKQLPNNYKKPVYKKLSEF